MLMSTSLVQAGRQALSECLDGLTCDLERMQDGIQQQFVEIVGSHAGSWISSTLYAALSGSAESLDDRSYASRSPRYQSGFFEQEDDYLWEDRPSRARDRSMGRHYRPAASDPDSPLATRVITLGRTLPAIISCLRQNRGRWPMIVVPLLGLLGSWLCGHFAQPALDD